MKRSQVRLQLLGLRTQPILCQL